MKKRIMFLVVILFVISMNSFLFAQEPVLPIDMEVAADDAWVGAGGATYSYETTLFTPDNVGKIVGGTDQWNSRINLALGTYIDMTTPNKTFTFEFYTTEAVTMNGLLQIGNEESGGYAIEMQFTTDGSIGWETITLDFNGATNAYPNAGEPVVYGQYAQISIFTNFGDTGTSTYYFDDIAGAANGTVVTTEPVPVVAAPTPSQSPGDVISMFSGAYTDVPVDTWLTPWSQGALEDVLIAGNPTKKYSSLNYAGIETTGANLIDVSGMTHFHIDMWTPDTNDFKIKLVDWGADGAYGGGDDTEHEIIYTAPTAETWISYDIPLTDFTNLVITGHMAQYILSKPTLGTIYIDNMYFYSSNVPGSDATLSDLQVDSSTIPGFAPLTENYTYGLEEGTVIVPQITSATPTDPNVTSVVITQASAIPGDATVVVTAEDGITTKTYTVSYAITIPNSLPPVPTQNSADVISMFSDTYTDVPVDTWRTAWSDATLEDISIAGNPVKKYSSLNFVGIETTGANLINASSMTHFHVDIWTPDANDFKVKLVDWGADAAYGGGDDSEHELTFTAPATTTWISYDISLADFTGLASTEHLAQYIYVKAPLGTIYLDNMFFYEEIPLIAPTNIVISKNVLGFTISWDLAAGATTYKVYSSDDPAAAPETWTLEAEGITGTTWGDSATDDKKFYYVVSSTDEP